MPERTGVKSRVSPGKRKEYEELKSFFVLWETQVSPRVESLDHSHDPVNCMSAIEEKYGFSIALKGLRQAIGDILEQTSDLPDDQVKKMDSALASGGYVTLSALRLRYRSTYASVLGRGRIRNATEFYLLSAVASDTTLDLPAEERASIEALLFSYQQEGITSRSTRSRAKTRAPG